MSDETIAKISLGGKEWPVPPLPWRVVKKLMPKMSKCAVIDTANLTDEKMEAIGDVMFLAVSAGTPELKRDDFENLAMSMREMINAIPIIAKQADLKLQEKPAGEAAE